MYDFQHLLGIDLGDLWRGTLSARRALVLSGQLLDDRRSHYRAAYRGGPEFLGWNEDTYLLASIRDEILVLMASLGGEKVTAEDMWPRPSRAISDDFDPEVGTIADFDDVGFMRQLTRG